jgi:hypothetical protein
MHPKYHSLLCHPNTPADFIKAIDICYTLLHEGMLWIRYSVDVPVKQFVICLPAKAERTDDLWHSTCFEAFVAIDGSTEYIEFNFTPSSRWAAYQFEDIRKGRTDLSLLAAPKIHLDSREDYFALEARVQLPDKWRKKDLNIGVAMVVTEISSKTSYWALNHKKAHPDFHDRSCFIIQVKAAEQS